jgi:hypothetical protein
VNRISENSRVSGALRSLTDVVIAFISGMLLLNSGKIPCQSGRNSMMLVNTSAPRHFLSPANAQANSALGKDDLITDPKASRISFANYAIALVDELEKPQHHRERFTIGY